MNNKKYLLENINRDYLIQGICVVNNYYLITAYSKDKSKKSIVNIYDENFKYIKTTILDNNAHVGGITYDNNNHIIWISDKSGTISGYKKIDIFKNENVNAIYKKVPVGIDLINFKNIPSVAYLYYYDNKIYLGNFLIFKKGELRCFDINKDGSINLNSKTTLSKSFDNFIQGIVIYKDYIIASRSYGKVFNSKISVYDKNYKKLSSYNIHLPMSEQLTIKNNKLIIASENASNYYRGSKGNDIIICDINDFIK